jgi:hypothetical protein
MESSKGEAETLPGFRCQLRLWDVGHASGKEPAGFAGSCLRLLAVAYRLSFQEHLNRYDYGMGGPGSASLMMME